MNQKQVCSLLAKRIKDSGSSEAGWARDNGLSQGYVTHVLNGKQAPGKKILIAIGLRKVISYQRITKPKRN